MALIDEIKAGQAEVEAETNTIAIEDGISIPETKRSGGKAKYPWSDLGKGQSFFVPGAKVETFYTLCSSASKKLEGRKFIARKWDGEGGVKGVRVWRSE